MRQIMALYQAQARSFLRDRMTLFFVLLLPVAFGVFFGLVFSGGGDFQLTLGLVNEDQGPAGEQFLEALRPSEDESGVVFQAGSRDEMLAHLEKTELHAVLLLPARFSQSLASGEPAPVEVYYAPSQPTSSGIALGVVRSMLAEASQAFSGAAPVLRIEQKSVQSKTLRSIDFFMPGMLGVALLWLGVFGTAQPFAAQREAQVFRRLSVTPLSRAAVLAAEVGWRVTVGLLQTALFLLVGYFAFGVGVLDWLPFLGAVLLGTLVFVSLGYVLAGIGRSMESTMGIAQLINFPMMMLSGSIFSAEMLPSFFQPIVNAMPLTYLSDLLRVSMTGAAPMHPMGLSFLVLGAWLVVLLGLAIKLWRWE
jgi:ABC-2 type transport system permease protein